MKFKTMEQVWIHMKNDTPAVASFNDMQHKLYEIDLDKSVVKEMVLPEFVMVFQELK